MTDNKYKIKYERHGDAGVLTESFPDGTWRTISRPVNDWLYIASRIQAANREETANREQHNAIPD